MTEFVEEDRGRSSSSGWVGWERDLQSPLAYTSPEISDRDVLIGVLPLSTYDSPGVFPDGRSKIGRVTLPLGWQRILGANMRKLILTLGIVGLVVACASPSQAAIDAGAVVAWHDDFDLGVGARATFPVDAISEKVSGVGEFLFFFPDDGGGALDITYWEINGNLIHDFAIESSSFVPYAGAGINLARISISLDLPDNPFITDSNASDTDIGINILGGAAFPNASFSPFIEGKIELGGGDSFVITFGASIPIGGDN